MIGQRRKNRVFHGLAFCLLMSAAALPGLAQTGTIKAGMSLERLASLQSNWVRSRSPTSPVRNACIKREDLVAVFMIQRMGGTGGPSMSAEFETLVYQAIVD